MLPWNSSRGGRKSPENGNVRHVRRSATFLWSLLDEAVRELELRRLRRTMRGSRLPIIYALATLAVAWVTFPFFFTEGGPLAGRDPIGNARGWSVGSMFAACACAAGLAGYLRAQALWNSERRVHALQMWLLTRQQPARVALTVVLTSGLFGMALTVAPAAMGCAAAVLEGVPLWRVLPCLAITVQTALLGGAVGAAVFFGANDLPPRWASRTVAALPVVILFTFWLGIEAAENGWHRQWDEHPGRVGRAALLLTPAPAMAALTVPAWWARHAPEHYAVPLPAWLVVGGYCLLLAVGTVAATGCSIAGYRRLAAAPHLLLPRPRSLSPEAPGGELYWQGFRNPVLTRDVRTRLRSKEASEFLLFASLAVAAGAFVPLVAVAGDLSDPLETARAAREVFFWLTLTLVTLAALLAPGLTADALTQERAVGELEMLIATPLRPRDILLGRLLGASLVLLLLVTPSLPLFSLCYLFHGASAVQVMQVYGLVVLTILVGSLIGITQSAIQVKPGLARFWAYASTLLFAAFPGGPLWLAAWAAAPQAELRQQLSIQGAVAGLMAVFYVGFLVLFWGNACEQLEYSEY
jgi:hypothetical protein